MAFSEIVPEMFSRSRLMYLDFAEIPQDTPDEENIARYFETCRAQGVDPTLPANRQRFNNQLLARSGARYLVSRYAEDRSAMLAGSQIAAEGRTYHLGIDIFSKDLEPVLAPAAGHIVRTGREPGEHSYGNYLIFKPVDTEHYLFLGHLGLMRSPGSAEPAGRQIALLGDFATNQNGGWSRHLHLQILTELPPDGETPIGYSTHEDLEANTERFPNPLKLFPDWQILDDA